MSDPHREVSGHLKVEMSNVWPSLLVFLIYIISLAQCEQARSLDRVANAINRVADKMPAK